METNEEKTKKSRRNALSLSLVFLALTAFSIVFAVLCLHNTANGFFRRNALVFSLLAGALLVFSYALAVFFVVKGKETVYKTFLSGYILLAFCLIVLFILQTTGFFKVIQDENSLREYLATKGAWMPVLYVVLQYLQVIILPIPSVVSTMAGVALFGPFATTLYSLIGVLAGSFTGFWVGRKLGNKAVAWMIGEETLKKWQKKLKGKDNLLLTLMFILPVFPDDVLCFVAGLSSMSTRYFVVMIIFSRILQISVTCYSLDIIPFTTWWGLALWIAFFALLLTAFVVVYKNVDKIQKWITKRFPFTKNGKK